MDFDQDQDIPSPPVSARCQLGPERSGANVAPVGFRKRPVADFLASLEASLK